MNAAAAALLTTAFAIVFLALVVGVAAGGSRRATATVLADVHPDLWEEQIKLLRLRHPEVNRYSREWQRLDRHDAYVWLHIGLLLVGLGILFAHAPNSILTELSWNAQKSLGGCILVGSSVALAGISMGLRFGPFYVKRSVSRNLVMDLLGDDVRLPYAFAVLGLVSVSVGLGGYGWTIYEYSDLVGTLSGGLTFAIIGMCITLGYKFAVRAKRYARKRNALLAEVALRIDEDEP